MIVVASKADVANPDKLKKLQAMAKRRKLPFYAISAVSGLGVDKLKYAIGERVRDLRNEAIAVTDAEGSARAAG
jgi:GTP-binding protein